MAATGCSITNRMRWASTTRPITRRRWRPAWRSTATISRAPSICWPCTGCCAAAWGTATTLRNIWVAPSSYFCAVSPIRKHAAATGWRHKLNCWMASINCWKKPMKHDAALDALFSHFDALAEVGHMRRLSAAFARFIASLEQDAPDAAALGVACMVLSELEGRGHSCLMLDELADGPSQLMGWQEDLWQALLAISGPLPETLEAWHALLARAPQVRPVRDDDLQQPLVLDGARLYLRRYWRDETLVGRRIAERAGMTVVPPLEP